VHSICSSSFDVVTTGVTQITNGNEVEFLLLNDDAMAIKEFTDALGTRWVVWATVPAPGGVLGTMREGWLTFESNYARRRLIPIPRDWEEVSNERMELMCRAAVPVQRNSFSSLPALDDSSNAAS
jgi:hypothetical protein